MHELVYFGLSWVFPFATAGAFVGFIIWHNRPHVAVVTERRR